LRVGKRWKRGQDRIKTLRKTWLAAAAVLTKKRLAGGRRYDPSLVKKDSTLVYKEEGGLGNSGRTHRSRLTHRKPAEGKRKNSVRSLYERQGKSETKSTTKKKEMGTPRRVSHRWTSCLGKMGPDHLKRESCSEFRGFTVEKGRPKIEHTGKNKAEQKRGRKLPMMRCGKKKGWEAGVYLGDTLGSAEFENEGGMAQGWDRGPRGGSYDLCQRRTRRAHREGDFHV